jgi:hypothetical protein
MTAYDHDGYMLAGTITLNADPGSNTILTTTTVGYI